MYKKGRGVPQDDAQAEWWNRKAAGYLDPFELNPDLERTILIIVGLIAAGGVIMLLVLKLRKLRRQEWAAQPRQPED